MTHRG